MILVKIALDLLKPEEFPRRGQFFLNLPRIAGAALQKGTWGAEIHDAIKPAPGEHVIGKCVVSAFARSKLEEILKRHGITDLILTGVATNMVVESTARAAVDKGYSVITVENGVTTFSEEVHQAALATLRSLGDVAPADEVAAAYLQTLIRAARWAQNNLAQAYAPMLRGSRAIGRHRFDIGAHHRPDP